MASGSVQGLTVWVKLRLPQNNDVVYGVVQDLVAGSHLALRDGMASSCRHMKGELIFD